MGWPKDGIPLALLVPTAALGIASAATAICAGGAMRYAAGWAFIMLMLLLQAVGLHLMWTHTWNIMIACALLIESESMLAIATCVGICSVCAPWYVGRCIYPNADFPERAIVGCSAWACEELLCLKGLYMHKIGPMWTRICFWHLDTALHLLAAWMLLQHCAHSIHPLHVVGSAAITIFWGCTVSLHHKIVDWQAVRCGRFQLLRWGSSSFFEPMKIAYIYQFKNKHVPQDTSFEDAVTGILSIIFLSHLFMGVVSALPRAGQMFFRLSLGEFVSLHTLAILTAYCSVIGVAAGAVGVAKLFWYRTKALHESKRS